jgi:hypothetical protein
MNLNTAARDIQISLIARSSSQKLIFALYGVVGLVTIIFLIGSHHLLASAEGQQWEIVSIHVEADHRAARQFGSLLQFFG